MSIKINKAKRNILPIITLMSVFLLVGCSNNEKSGANNLDDAPLDLGYVEEIDEENDEKFDSYKEESKKEVIDYGEDVEYVTEEDGEEHPYLMDEFGEYVPAEEVMSKEQKFNQELSDAVDKHIYEGNVDKKITKDEFNYFINDLKNHYEHVLATGFDSQMSELNIYLYDELSDDDLLVEILPMRKLIAKVYKSMNSEGEQKLIENVNFRSKALSFTYTVSMDILLDQLEDDM